MYHRYRKNLVTEEPAARCPNSSFEKAAERLDGLAPSKPGNIKRAPRRASVLPLPSPLTHSGVVNCATAVAAYVATPTTGLRAAPRPFWPNNI